IYRYVWDGRLQRLGYNPYIVVPSDPAVKGLHTPETRNLNNPDLPSPYPAGAQLFFRAVTAIHESTFALKVAFVVCDLVIVFVLLDVLRCNRQGAHLVLAYAWNPLLAIEVAGSGHIEIVGALLLVVSAAASWAGSARRISNCNLVYKSIAENGSARVVSGCICLANGSMSLVCTRRIPMVSSLAAAIPDVGLDAAAYHLDCEHYPHLRP